MRLKVVPTPIYKIFSQITLELQNDKSPSGISQCFSKQQLPVKVSVLARNLATKYHIL